MVSAGRRPNVLNRKLWRDMRHSAMQFVAILLLCALGTWVYSGLDGTWRMIQLSSETYYTDYALADLWVNRAGLTKAERDTLANLPGVQTVQARTSVELDAPTLGDDVSVLVHATQGKPLLNLPLVRQGEALRQGDDRGCLLDERFALANGLSVGDTLTLTVNDQDRHFTIRGLILSPEHVILTKDVMPDAAKYGFALLNWEALSPAPPNELLVGLAPGADAAAVETEIQNRFPEALILTQKTHASTQRTRNEVVMFRNLTMVFPLLAYAVASMVVLTTLTRMIENQRTQMGTLKALGYGSHRIRNHYVNYALLPSMAGALLGLFVGRYTLPDMLYAMEADHYTLPQKLRPPIALEEWGITALMVLLSVGICLYAYRKAAREEAANLLRPKPPRSGSRVLLERFKGLWGRFSFNTKLIVRNIARNKGRVTVSMVGLLCCNMLIICAMGLQESVQACVDDYYSGTVAYDLRAELDSTAATLAGYQARLNAERVEGVMETTVSLRYGGQSRAASLCVLKEDQTLLRLGQDYSVLPLPKTGIAISRKLADVTSLKQGDAVSLWLPGDDEGLPFTVDAVLETNIGQTIYMAADVWDGLRKGAFQPTALLLKGPTALTVSRLNQADEVTSFKDPREQARQMMSILDSTTAVFSLMYGAALGLAFVISYNMGLITFTERTRDYATLKVLGYHQKEIRTLMMRENNLITAVGAALGIGPGIWLTQVVLTSVRAENNVFIAHVSPATIAFATAITCLFSILIERLLTRKVRAIDMVEALKSVE